MPESKFNEFEQHLKSPKNRFQLSAGLNLETLNTILSETNHISLNSASGYIFYSVRFICLVIFFLKSVYDIGYWCKYIGI